MSRLYHDQLAMTERHLGTLIEDANCALKVLETLCESFRAVEDQTRSFQSQCDDLLSEQKRLQGLADEVGTDLYYYGYLDTVTRRLNAPGAVRLVDDDSFEEILGNLESCIAFMSANVCPTPICYRCSLLTCTIALISGCGVISCTLPSASDEGFASSGGCIYKSS